MQIISNHQIVPEKTYVGDAVKLPSSDQVPFLDLEVESEYLAKEIQSAVALISIIDYHRPALGT